MNVVAPLLWPAAQRSGDIEASISGRGSRRVETGGSTVTDKTRFRL